MTPRPASILGALAALACASAYAQPAADPIDVLLRPLPQDSDVDQPNAGSPAPSTFGPPRGSTLTTPVFVNETGRNPDPPPTSAEAAYDSRLRSSAASAQGFQGPMDGGWTLAAGAQALYAFQLLDRNGAVEGSWRDLRRAGALDGSGFFDVVERNGGDLTFRFGDGTVAVLRAQGGRWVGQLTEAGRTTDAVSLTRRVP